MGQEGCVYNRCSHLRGISQFIKNEWGRKVVSTIGVHISEVFLNLLGTNGAGRLCLQ